MLFRRLLFLAALAALPGLYACGSTSRSTHAEMHYYHDAGCNGMHPVHHRHPVRGVNCGTVTRVR